MEEFAGESFPEVPAPDGEEERGGKEKDGVEARAAFAGPVELVLEIEPESEFIESERGSDAVEERHQAAGEERGSTSAGADFHQPGETHAKKDEDSPDEMVDVSATNDDVMKRPDVAGGGESGEAGESNGGKETGSGEEETAFGAVADVFMKECADAGAVQTQENKGCGEENSDGKEPGIVVHEGSAPAKRKYSVRSKLFGGRSIVESEMQMGEEGPGRATAAVEYCKFAEER
jgi:hypothetical protein